MSESMGLQAWKLRSRIQSPSVSVLKVNPNMNEVTMISEQVHLSKQTLFMRQIDDKQYPTWSLYFYPFVTFF